MQPRANDGVRSWDGATGSDLSIRKAVDGRVWARFDCVQSLALVGKTLRVVGRKNGDCGGWSVVPDPGTKKKASLSLLSLFPFELASTVVPLALYKVEVGLAQGFGVN